MFGAGNLIGAVVSCSGLVLIAGWMLEWKAIVQPLPGHSMVLGTACGFVLAGLSAMTGGLTHPRLHALHSSIGLMLAMLGAIGIGQNLSGIPMGLDFPDVHAWLAHQYPDTMPGHMSCTTSAGFLLLGSMLVLAPRARSAMSSVLVRGLAVAVAGLGGVALVAHLVDLPRMLEPSNWLKQFPVPAAAGFVAVAAALWLDLRRARTPLPQLVKSAVGRIALSGMLVLAISVAVTGVMVFSLMHSATQQILTTNLAFTLTSRRGQIDRTISQAAAQAVEVTRRQGIARVYSDARNNVSPGPDPSFLNKVARDQLLVDFLAFAFLDADGREVARAGEFVVKSDFHLPLPPLVGSRAVLLWDGDLMLSVRADIIVDGIRVGEISAQHRLPDLRGIHNDIEALGATTEFALCGWRAGSLHCMPTRFEPRVLDVPEENDGARLPMSYATQGRTGVLELNDRRDHRVLAAYAPVENLGLGVVLKTDVSELAAPVVQRMAPFVLLLMSITVAGGWLLYTNVAPLASRLSKSEEQLRMALDGSKLALWDWDIRAERVHLSDQWNVLLGGAPKPTTCSTADLFAILHPEDSGNVQRGAQQLLNGCASHYDTEHRVRTLAGEWKWIRSRGHIVSHAADGSPLRALGTNVDISERKAYELELAHHAAHDVLTGLPNRGLFEDRLEQAIARARRSIGMIAVLYVDIDRFKSVNDGFGHAAGDALLKEFAQRLSALVRNTDTVARLGGDEFAVVLESLDQRESGLRMAGSLVAAMRRTFDAGGRQIQTSVSVGVAFFDGAVDEIDSGDLLGAADRALYAAKAAGRDRLCIAEPPRPAKRLRLA
jgi:diguanylate cyclase (GGDEF)-like protein/PAS domain S-box-containing protein